MEANNLSLKEAAKLTSEPLADDQQQNVQVNWVEAVNRFLTEEKAGLRETTLRDTKLRMNRVLQVLNKTPRSRNRLSLMKRYLDIFLFNDVFNAFICKSRIRINNSFPKPNISRQR